MQQTKSQVRARILAARRASTPASRAAEAAALTRHLVAWIPRGATVCAYVPVGTEPGSADLLDELMVHDAVVLLPVAREDPVEGPRPLRWGRYRPGTLVAAPFGLREPPPPHLPPESVADAAAVLVPALAVDRRGARLGRGAGFYDRTLRLASPAAALIAVVRDEEFVDRLPADPHDVPMTHAVTPDRGVVELERGRE
ncbi:MAG: 5-formyltetrahydrofolate cyclo-ligase [Mycolicibacterium rufum]|nr:5-formyltetrahydrofolate cyclo-ligase [Mycolicibacterium rufum]